MSKCCHAKTARVSISDAYHFLELKLCGGRKFRYWNLTFLAMPRAARSAAFGSDVLPEVQRHGISPFTLHFCGCVRVHVNPSNLHFQYSRLPLFVSAAPDTDLHASASHMARQPIEPRPAENDVAKSVHVSTIAGVSPNNGVDSSATPVDSTSPASQPEQIPDGAAVAQGDDAAVRGDTPVPDGRVITYTE